MEPAPPNYGQTPGTPAFAGMGAVPLFHAAWLFAAGIASTAWLFFPPGQILVALALVAMLCAVAAFRAQRIAWLPVAFLWLLLGAWCAEMEPQPAPAPTIAALSDGLLRTVEGTIVDAAPIRGELEQRLNDHDDPDPAAPQPQPTQRIDLSVSNLEVVTDADDTQVPATGGVRLTVRWPAANKAAPPVPQPFHCGDRIRASARLLQPETYRDPGVWSREDFLLDQGITSTATLNIDRIERIGPSPGAFVSCRLAALQHASSARLLALPAAMCRLPAPLRLSPDDAVMMAAMVTGDRTYLTHSLRVGFERTGSFHMLVVSGFHLAIVAGVLFWFARRLHLPRVPATLLTILASFGYALFTGFATPVQRSLWMVTLYLLGRLLYRERSPMNTIGFASLCLMALSPRSVFESSLQMTLLAVVSIAGVAAPLLQGTVHPYLAASRDLRLTALDAKLAPNLAQFRITLRMVATTLQAIFSAPRPAPGQPHAPASDADIHPQLALLYDTAGFFASAFRSATHDRFAESIPWRLFPWAVQLFLRIVELMVVSCVVELAMTLPMAIYFHRITIFALPVNLFILPLLVVLMPAALATLLALFTWPAAAVVPAIVVAVFLHFGVGLVRIFGSLAFGDFRIPTPLLGQSAAFCVLLGAAVLLARGGKWPRRLAWAALFLAAFAAVAPRPIQHPTNALLVEAIDVGQGDSILLITPDGKTLLVDGGGVGGGPRQSPQEFDIGEQVVSAALWSRGIRRLDVVALSHAHSDHMGGLPAVLRNFHPAELWVGNNPSTPPYDALLKQAASLRIRIRALRAGDAFPLGPTQVHVLAPFAGYQPGAEPANNDSLVLHVSFEATSVLLEGDAEAPIEQAMLAEPGLQSTLLKVGHHGSVTSTLSEFLARVAPRWAVISCGLHNRYGHPRREILNELQSAHVRTCSTDINGATCFRLDGKNAFADASCSWRQIP